jgi:hypothetical protein
LNLAVLRPLRGTESGLLWTLCLLIRNLDKAVIEDTNALIQMLLFDIERWSQHNRVAHGRLEAQTLA